MEIIARLYYLGNTVKISLASSLNPGIEITSQTFNTSSITTANKLFETAKNLTGVMATEFINYYKMEASNDFKKTDNRTPASDASAGLLIFIILPMFFGVALAACEMYFFGLAVFLVGEAFFIWAATN